MSRIELETEDRKAEWEEVKFTDLYERLYGAKIVRNQTELAKLLKLGRAAVSYVSRKGIVPREWKVRLERAGISWEWASTGVGGKYNPNRLVTTSAIVAVKRIGLSDNGDDSSPRNERDTYGFPLHKLFLTQQNVDGSNLGYLVQNGIAMNPIASDGDVWIVDLNVRELSIGCTYAVSIGSEVSISTRTVLNIDSIDRVVTLGHGNKDIPPQSISMDHVRVAGRCVLKVCKVM